MSIPNDPCGASKIAAEVAPFLPGWTFQPPGEDSDRDVWAYLVREDGARVILYTRPVWHGDGKDSRRVEISGSFPKNDRGHMYGRYSQTSRISVAATRTPEQIANEIKRRLLPIYLKNYAEALEAKRADDARRSAADQLAGKIAPLLGCECRPGYDESRLHPRTIDGTSAAVTIGRDGTATFEVRLYADESEDLAALAFSLAAWVQLNLQERPEDDPSATLDDQERAEVLARRAS